MVARLRAAGAWPWLLLAGWLLVASLQEPLTLRRYGIRILDDAAWIGGLFVLVVLLLAVQEAPRRFARSANVLTLVLVAGLNQAGVLVLDRAPGMPDLTIRMAQGILFVLAWLPLSLTLPGSSLRAARGWAAGYLVPSLAFLVGVVLSVSLRSDPSPVVIGGAMLAASASIMT